MLRCKVSDQNHVSFFIFGELPFHDFYHLAMLCIWKLVLNYRNQFLDFFGFNPLFLVWQQIIALIINFGLTGHFHPIEH